MGANGNQLGIFFFFFFWRESKSAVLREGFVRSSSQFRRVCKWEFVYQSESGNLEQMQHYDVKMSSLENRKLSEMVCVNSWK